MKLSNCAAKTKKMNSSDSPNTISSEPCEFLNSRAIPDYQSVNGNISVHILERTEGEVTHFITLTFWKDMKSIKAFAGEEVETAKYYPEDKGFLLEFEPKVVHYEVVGHS